MVSARVVSGHHHHDLAFSARAARLEADILLGFPLTVRPNDCHPCGAANHPSLDDAISGDGLSFGQDGIQTLNKL